MWYWLGSIGVFVLVLLFALFYWGRNERRDEDLTAPTTGVADDERPGATPGSINPDPRVDSPDEEIKYRTR